MGNRLGWLMIGVLAACTGGEPDMASWTAAVGVAPVNQMPPPQTANEDSTLFFSVLGGNALAVTDADNAVLTVQVTVTGGSFTLARTTGLAVTGDGTADVIASGPIDAIDSALDGARFDPGANYAGAATLQMHSSDSNGESDLDVLAINVTAFNDAPVNAAPTGVQAATEDVPRAFILSVSDPDVAGAPVQVSLAASNATTLTLPTTAGIVFSAGDGAADAAMTFSGTLPDVNAALNGVVVTPPLNYIGASTLVIDSSDQGASGAGNPGSDHDSIDIAWAAVNDAPVNTVPAAQAMNEDDTLALAGLAVADVDASTALVQVTLAGGGGTVTLGNPAAVTFTAGDGTADASMTFTGTLAALGTALAGTSFRPTANFAGTATLTMTSNDLGNSGAGGVKQDTDVVAIAVAAINDAPVNTVPSAQVGNEDVARVFSTANGNPITVADPDAASLQVTLTASGGALTLAGTTGLSFLSGDGNGDVEMSFGGTAASINAAFNGLRFTPGANSYGTAALDIHTTDLGATGAGGELADDDTIAITVAAVNDAPSAGNDVLAVAEDAAATAVAVLGNDTAAPDAGETLAVTAVGTPLHGIAATDGTVVTYTPAPDYAGTDSVAYTLSDGAGGTATATIAIVVSSVNDAPGAADDLFSVTAGSVGNSLSVLSNDSSAPDVGETLAISAVAAPLHGSAVITSGATRVSYTPDAGYSGADSFTYTLSDGSGGTSTATVDIDVASVVTQPVSSLPAPQTIVEDSPLFFSSAAGNPLTVSDANNTTLTVQVLVGNGTFTLGTTSGLTVSGNASSSVTASGTITALNTGLNNARYTPTANFAGPTSLTLNASDTNGESDLDVLTLAVTSFNDPPVNNVPTTTQSATEDAPRTFSTISVTDVDLNGAAVVVSLTASNGTLISLPTHNGLSFSAGTGTADATMTFAGTLSSVNVALNGLTVTSPADYIGPSTLVITSNDQGASGAGVVGQDTDTINLSWTSVNDAPVNDVPPALTTAEEEPVTFALRLADADAAAGTMQVQLTATAGTVTLGNPAGVTYTVGDGIADTTTTFRGTIGELNAALEGTRFQPNPNVTGTATVTMVTNDLGNTGGSAKTDTDVVSVTISPVNDAPVVTVPGALTTSEDIARVLSASQGNAVTVADVDATALQVSLAALDASVTLATRTGLTFQAGDGTADVTMTFTGTVAAITGALNGMTLIPAANHTGTSGLTISASDLGASGAGGPLSDEDGVTMWVTAVNDPPDAVADSASTVEDAAAIDVWVLGNDAAGPDGGETVSITAITQPAHGTAAIVGDRVTYQPAPNYQGADSFGYTIGDGNGGVDSATVTIAVAAVNDPPTAVDDAYTVVESSTGATLAVRSNDTALPDTGETLTVVGVTAPLHGTATVNGSGSNTTVRYVPTPGYHGPDELSYAVSDGVLIDSATVTITVTSIDTQPVANDDNATIGEDGTLTLTVLGNDTGIADAPLTVAITAAPAHGTATVLDDLRIAFAPEAEWHGSDAFTYQVTDEDGDVDTATVHVTVSAVDDHPAAVADALDAVEDETVELDVLGNDAGVGDGPLVVTIVTAATHGTVTALATGAVRYVPAADYSGADAFAYKVVDADGDQATGQATVAVAAVNDAPVALADVASARTDTAVAIDVTENDRDADGDTLEITAVTQPVHGTAAIGDTGEITYTPAAGYTGMDGFDYTIDDGQGETATATVSIGVGIDGDGDGLLDLDEVEVHHTDPTVADTDADLLDDGVEVMAAGTDPLDDDSDDDGLIDGHEHGAATSATEADSDGDGLSDGLERGLAAPEGDDTDGFTADADPATTTDPARADSDGGGVADGIEDENHDGRVGLRESDPNDPADDVADEEPEPGGCNAGGGGGGLGLLAILFAVASRRARRPRR